MTIGSLYCNWVKETHFAYLSPNPIVDTPDSTRVHAGYREKVVKYRLINVCIARLRASSETSCVHHSRTGVFFIGKTIMVKLSKALLPFRCFTTSSLVSWLVFTRLLSTLSLYSVYGILDFSLGSVSKPSQRRTKYARASCVRISIVSFFLKAFFFLPISFYSTTIRKFWLSSEFKQWIEYR